MNTCRTIKGVAKVERSGIFDYTLWLNKPGYHAGASYAFCVRKGLVRSWAACLAGEDGLGSFA